MSIQNHPLWIWLTEPRDAVPDAFWRSLLYFNWYRLVVVLIISLFLWRVIPAADAVRFNLHLFFYFAWVYLAFCLVAFLTIYLRKPRFHLQLTWQVSADIAFTAMLMLISGDNKIGFGILLIPYLAAAGLISRGRMTLFHAAIASLAILSKPIYNLLLGAGQSEKNADLSQVALLCISYFATAWLAHRLAEYARENERLAHQRGQAVAKLSALNELVIQSIPNGIIITQTNGEIVHINQQAEYWLGNSQEQNNIMDYAPNLAEKFIRWQKGEDERTHFITSPQTGKILEARFAALQNPSDLSNMPVDNSAVIFLDDAERRQTQAQQIKLAALGRLTANIAHEIRNPLSAISHASDLLAEEIDSPIGRRLVKIMRDNIDRLDKIVKDVLELNRRDHVKTKTIRLNQYLPEFIQSISAAEKFDPLVFSCHIESNLCIAFDPNHLQQVLWNIVCNAHRHSQKKAGSIQIHAWKNTKYCHLGVQDDGEGVPEAQKPHLYEPFFTTAIGGNGLGLYIAKEICAANSAQLRLIESTRGACFQIRSKLDYLQHTPEHSI